MSAITINRSISNLDINGRNLTFLLNGERVYINYDINYMHVRSEEMSLEANSFWSQNRTLVEFVDKIYRNEHGTIPLDTTNKDIMDFLKRTKCIPSP